MKVNQSGLQEGMCVSADTAQERIQGPMALDWLGEREACPYYPKRQAACKGPWQGPRPSSLNPNPRMAT